MIITKLLIAITGVAWLWPAAILHRESFDSQQYLLLMLPKIRNDFMEALKKKDEKTGEAILLLPKFNKWYTLIAADWFVFICLILFT